MPEAKARFPGNDQIAAVALEVLIAAKRAKEAVRAGQRLAAHQRTANAYLLWAQAAALDGIELEQYIARIWVDEPSPAAVAPWRGPEILGRTARVMWAFANRTR